MEGRCVVLSCKGQCIKGSRVCIHHGNLWQMSPEYSRAFSSPGLRRANSMFVDFVRRAELENL